MGTPRTLKRRRQRKAHKAAVLKRAAEWAALSPDEQARRRKQRFNLDEMNRIAMENVRPELIKIFEGNDAFYRMLKAR